MKHIKLLFVVLAGALITLSCAKTYNAKDLGDGLFARITTNRGEIIARLEYERAPLTVCNFVALAEGRMDSVKGKRFYNGLTFHNVISLANGDDQDFMIQSGCPIGNGFGGPGYDFPDEFNPELRHDRPGVLSMANRGIHSNGSQFFISLRSLPHLDDRYAVFGYVVHGQDIANSIIRGDTIKKVTIIRNGESAKAFKANQESFNGYQVEVEKENKRKLDDQRQDEIDLINATYPNNNLTESGIRYVVQKTGSGDKPKEGMLASVLYTGKLLSGKVFGDSEGVPLEFTIGKGSILRSWDEVVMDMRAGEKRIAVIPPELAYWDRDIGEGLIPPYSFLVFEMELVSVREAAE